MVSKRQESAVDCVVAIKSFSMEATAIVHLFTLEAGSLYYSLEVNLADTYSSEVSSTVKGTPLLHDI